MARIRPCDKVDGDPEPAAARRLKVARVGVAWEARSQRRLQRYGRVVQPPELI